jgi:purine-cytosine permease-like protein
MLSDALLIDGNNDDPPSTIVHVSWLLNGPLTVLAAVLGAIGNLYSVQILAKLSIRPTTRLYLSFLSIANSAVCICSLFFYSTAEMFRPLIGDANLFQ